MGTMETIGQKSLFDRIIDRLIEGAVNVNHDLIRTLGPINGVRRITGDYILKSLGGVVGREDWLELRALNCFPNKSHDRTGLGKIQVNNAVNRAIARRKTACGLARLGPVVPRHVDCLDPNVCVSRSVSSRNLRETAARRVVRRVVPPKIARNGRDKQESDGKPGLMMFHFLINPFRAERVTSQPLMAEHWDCYPAPRNCISNILSMFRHARRQFQIRSHLSLPYTNTSTSRNSEDPNAINSTE
jgi:hypothetical protein